MNSEQFIEGLCRFLQASPTPFHAVRTLSAALEQSGYQLLNESDHWNLEAKGRYFITRNDSSIIAFSLGKETPEQQGFRIIGTHTDSPCLKVKPNADRHSGDYLQLGVEVYGGALLRPWFDRDLSLAGRVHYTNNRQQTKSQLVDFCDPIAIIPSLAIHLDKEANSQQNLNAQQHLLPVLMSSTSPAHASLKALLKEQLQQQTQENITEILDYELYFYDTQAPTLTGLKQEFISSARLDNLLSCYIGLMSLLESQSEQNCILICSDHEEVGSQSYCGAQSNFLESLLQRITGSQEMYARSLAKSWLVSVDNAHATHPNYPEKHDPQHLIKINQGPVIKINSNQRYSTSSETSALFRGLCKQAKVPYQLFSMRNDLGCGSTIGPMTASALGIKSIDVGVPQWAMHSIRETAGKQDAYSMLKVLKAFYRC